MPAKDKYILIADDSEINRTFLRGSLGEGYKFIEAEDGQQALDILKERHNEIALLLLDIMMPRLSGYEVLEAMQADKELSDIPVIVVTSENEIAAELRALESGASDFLTKPIEGLVARRRVKTVLEQRELEELRMEQRLVNELRYRADHDDLTGIYSKEAFYRETAKLIQADTSVKYSLVRTNIEKFKIINELFGRQTGDQVLCAMSDALGETIGSGGTYGRLDSDNLVFCIPTANLDLVKLENVFDTLWNGLDIEQVVVVCFGIVNIEDPTVPVDQLCDRAALAMNTIKGDFNVHYAYYDEQMRMTLLEEQDILDAMQAGLDNHEFEMYLQPVYSLSNGTPAAAEALVRWNRKGVGMVSPGMFIPLFERNGFIALLDYYMWDQVCSMLHNRKEQGLEPFPVSVNVSRRSLYSADLYDDIVGLVKKYDISPDLLRIEVTESAYMDNAALLIETVARLQDYGFTILMDDFGSGYSSFNTLKDIPVDILKVDMKFMEGFEKGGRVGTILTSILRMAKWLDIPVVAEGVETVEQCEFLRGIGCDYIQGFYFARPMPYEDFEAHISNSTPRQLVGDVEQFTHYQLSDVMGSNKLVDAVLSSSFDGFAVYEVSDGRMECVRASDGFMELFRFNEQSLKNYSRSGIDYVVAEDVPKARDALTRSFNGERHVFTLIRCKRTDGEEMGLLCCPLCIQKTDDLSGVILVTFQRVPDDIAERIINEI